MTKEAGRPRGVGEERWIPSDQVVAELAGDRMVLIHMETNRIFELNRTGARVWALLTEGRAQEEIVKQLEGEYDVPAKELRSEIRNLVDRLAAERLVTKGG